MIISASVDSGASPSAPVWPLKRTTSSSSSFSWPSLSSVSPASLASYEVFLSPLSSASGSCEEFALLLSEGGFSFCGLIQNSSDPRLCLGRVRFLTPVGQTSGYRRTVFVADRKWLDWSVVRSRFVTEEFCIFLCHNPSCWSHCWSRITQRFYSPLRWPAYNCLSALVPPP